MAKVLVDKHTGAITGVHRTVWDGPVDNSLSFSVSGHYVIDWPDFLGPVPALTTVANLVLAKGNAFQDAHRPQLYFLYSDELLTSPNVDPAESSGYVIGEQKKTVILPGGTVVTNLMSIPGTATTIYFRMCAFTLTPDPGAPSAQPGPPKVLYEDTSGNEDFVVEIRDAANAATLGLPVRPQNNVPWEQPFSFTGPGNIRLRFTNLLQTPINLSDWVFLYDSA